MVGLIFGYVPDIKLNNKLQALIEPLSEIPDKGSIDSLMKQTLLA